VKPTKKPVEYEVTCVVTEGDPALGERVVQVGGDGWQKLLSDVVLLMESGVCTFFTTVDGKRADVVKISPRIGPPYLRTTEDSETTNNLLALPQCHKQAPTRV